MKEKILIIAEAGVNHNGDIKIAKRFIDAAKEAGADIVKFQTFIAEKLVSKKIEKADYQKKEAGVHESQYEMIKRLELSEKDHYELLDYCNKINIKFLSTAFDLESIDLLKKLGLSIWKIPSGEITDYPYLKKIGSYNDEVILSTGMATLSEIEDAMNVLEKFGTNKKKITVLHCTTEYPAPINEVNLRAMITMKKIFGVRTGYSDHTRGIEIPIAAAALGAAVIEKHFTLDRNMSGPDHQASLEPSDLKAMVIAIRNVELALGDGVKKASESEIRKKEIVRKCIVARMRIKKGEVFTEENLTVKRAGKGISPMEWNRIIGTISSKDYIEDEVV